MPTTVVFPEQKFNATIQSSVKEFNFDAMILAALNRYYQQLIFFEICAIPFNLKQKYLYRFSDFEIISLGKQENIIKSREITAPFNFSLSLFQKKYCGKTNIKVKFKNGGTFENSCYEIDIEIISETSTDIYPFFLTESGFISHICEFMQKMWFSVFCVLQNIKESKKVEFHNYCLDNLIILPLNKNFKFTDLPNVLQDPIKDVYVLVTSVILSYGKDDSYIEISADDILSLRGLKKNKNSKGVKGGYKNNERQKIHYILHILNTACELIVREKSPYNYIVKLPFNKIYQTKKTAPLLLVQYSYKDELWQKRLGYYLFCNKNENLKVNELYCQIKDLCVSFKPAQIRDKFENAMDFLVQDKIICDWHYKKIDENKLQGKNWLDLWLRLDIVCRYYR